MEPQTLVRMDDLRNTDPEDLDLALRDVEKSFGFQFAKDELLPVTTFGEFCDVVARRLNRAPADTCTSQQAFYRLRAAFGKLNPQQPTARLKPDTPLAALLPRHGRRQRVAQLEQELGLSLRLLQPREWVILSWLLVLLGSCVGLFFQPLGGLLGLACAIAGMQLANRLGRELRLTTLRELVNLLLTDHYARVRRDAGTVNYRELPTVLRRLFAERLGLEHEALRPNSPFQ